MADVSFFDPKKEQQVKRQRAMAEMLMKQGQTQLGKGNEMVSGIVVKKSPLEGLAGALQMGLGGMAQGKAGQAEDEAIAQRQRLYQEALGSTDPRMAAQLLAQDPESLGTAAKLYGDALSSDQAAASRQQDWAREDTQRAEDARLKRELAAIRANQGGVTFDEETGQLTFNEPQQEPTNTLAPALGVPAVPINTQGLSGKDASTYIRNTRQNADKRLQDEEFTSAAQSARDITNKLSRFEELNQVQDTGGWRGLPVVGSVANFLDPQTREMKSIQDELAPLQRKPGSGASSDMDVAMFKNALPGPDKPKSTNDNIITARKAAASDVAQYQSFLNDFSQANGHLNGAETAWQQYINANPIFDPSSNPDDVNSIKLNSARKTYKQFFGAAQQTTPNQPTNQIEEIRAKLTAAGQSPERIEKYLRSKGLQ